MEYKIQFKKKKILRGLHIYACLCQLLVPSPALGVCINIWSTGKILLSFCKTTVRPAVSDSLSTNISLDSHLRCFRQDQSCRGRSLHVSSSLHPGKWVLTSVELATKLSWETVSTAGFELDVLRRKRPYKWTIWARLYII